jgi:hypothetical protein
MHLVGTDIVQSIRNTESVQRETYTHRVREYPGPKNSGVVPTGHANVVGQRVLRLTQQFCCKFKSAARLLHADW